MCCTLIITNWWPVIVCSQVKKHFVASHAMRWKKNETFDCFVPSLQYLLNLEIKKGVISRNCSLRFFICFYVAASCRWHAGHVAFHVPHAGSAFTADNFCWPVPTPAKFHWKFHSAAQSAEKYFIMFSPQELTSVHSAEFRQVWHSQCRQQRNIK